MKKDEYNSSMAVDGPKGPIYKVKPGVFELSKLTKAVIVPVGVASHPHLSFEKSWNKARLPKPFAKIHVFFSRPLDLDMEDLKSKKNSDALGDAIANACDRAAIFLRP